MRPRPNLTFSEYGHVAYQIKVENVCSNMVANILPTDTPSVNPYVFYESSHVAYQNKVN